jgi:hypothetical protein
VQIRGAWSGNHFVSPFDEYLSGSPSFDRDLGHRAEPGPDDADDALVVALRAGLVPDEAPLATYSSISSLSDPFSEGFVARSLVKRVNSWMNAAESGFALMRGPTRQA